MKLFDEIKNDIKIFTGKELSYNEVEFFIRVAISKKPLTVIKISKKIHVAPGTANTYCRILVALDLIERSEGILSLGKTGETIFQRRSTNENPC